MCPTTKNPTKNLAIESLFNPKTVAVLGASRNAGKIGYKVCENIVNGGYEGKLYPVNPNGGEVLGHKIYENIASINDEIDLAILTVPAKFVMNSVKECVSHGKVKNLAIITSGFAEIGNEEEEEEIVRVAREGGIRVLGPNIFGVYSAKAKLNSTFAAGEIPAGNVAIITQSGAIGIAMIGKTKVENIGLSTIISCGNKADIDDNDLLEYLATDDSTHAIMMYIEGIQNGDKLVPLLKKLSKAKPLVVIKSGRSERGAQAAQSHTASLAGSDEVFDAVAKQCGIIRADSLEEGLQWCKYLVTSPPLKGKECVIITNGGGVGVMGTDACEKYGIPMYDDQKELEKAFKSVCPDFGSLKNPVDITGGATPEDYDHCLDAALNNDKIHSVICLGCETAVLTGSSFKSIVQKQTAQYRNKKPLVFSLVGGEEMENAIRELRREDAPIYNDVEPAVACLGTLYSYTNFKNTKEQTLVDPPVDIPAIKEIIAKVKADNRTFLLTEEAQAVMKAADIAVPQNRVESSADAAAKAATEIGYPVVMKIVSKDIIHKSDAGGLALNLKNEAEVKAAYNQIMTNCKKHMPNADLKGVEVVEMVDIDVETIVSARRDNSFGPTVMFGLGGIYVEVLKDITFRAFPLSEKEILEMIESIKSYQLLKGARGKNPKDITAAVDAIAKVGKILKEIPEITDVELNPIILNDEGKGVRAVDVRILLAE